MVKLIRSGKIKRLLLSGLLIYTILWLGKFYADKQPKRIPKKLHQIWLGNLSRKPTKLMERCQKMHPTWEYRLWTDKDIGQLKLSNLPFFNAWRAHQLAGAADVLRYELLYKFGGVYMDSDQLCLRPMDDLLGETAFLGYETLGNPGGRPDWPLINNAVMGATKQHPFLKQILGNLTSKVSIQDLVHHNAWYTVGPLLVTDIFKDYNLTDTARNWPVVVHNYSYFYPYWHQEKIDVSMSPTAKHVRLNSYVLSFWGGSPKKDYSHDFLTNFDPK